MRYDTKKALRKMGIIKYPDPVYLFIGFIYNKTAPLNEIKRCLEKELGEIDFESEVFSFIYTHYYDSEMGEDLYRSFIGFKDFVSREQLPMIKIKTNEIELNFLRQENRGRTINIDPGYISLESVVLATTKNYTHRIYLGKGIYAELVYVFRNRSFGSLDWTYPDYKERGIMDIFNKLRAYYLERLRRNRV